MVDMTALDVYKNRFMLRVVTGLLSLFLTPILHYAVHCNPKSAYLFVGDFALALIQATSTGALTQWATLSTVKDDGYGVEQKKAVAAKAAMPGDLQVVFIVTTVMSLVLSLCHRWCDGSSDDDGMRDKWSAITCATFGDWNATAQAASFVGAILYFAPMNVDHYTAKRTDDSVKLGEAKRALAQVEAKLATARQQAKTPGGKDLAGLYYHTHSGVLNTGISVNGDDEIVGPPHIHSKLPWGATTYYKTSASAEDMKKHKWKAGSGDLEGMIVDENGDMVEDKLADDAVRSESHTHNFALQGGGVIATADFIVAEGEAPPVKDEAEGMTARGEEWRGAEKAQGSMSMSMSGDHRETPMHDVTSDKVPSM
jgi:hypothetical protein